MTKPISRKNLCVWGMVGLMFAGLAYAAPDCKVLDPELQTSYEGDCLNGLAQGQGVARGANGAFYQGGFDAGAASGYGVKLYANGDAYAGEWLQGYRHGQGVYEYGEHSPWRGDKYVGQWDHDQRHGRGSYLVYPTGEAFTGDWNMGQTDTLASPMMVRRKRTFEALAPVLGQVGAELCSTLTDGASPRNIARGRVVAVQDERIQVLVETPEVLRRSALTVNPRWDVMTEWMVCAQ
ncbi:hypothetical protein LKR43_14455 [Pusillimonas sp. MFBS29]|uniref:hypothetical protein n=1 Tax=Pusillimonas sp. MFBS29 TaxID=2886690 RepID=UPI001D12B493|nr:hypothetical protein [Pusillimonas sp. MFBS29]MCC2597536.1 hypothetical protein [Pusillimonas sp. MFBS29]